MEVAFIQEITSHVFYFQYSIRWSIDTGVERLQLGVQNISFRQEKKLQLDIDGYCILECMSDPFHFGAELNESCLTAINEESSFPIKTVAEFFNEM